MKPPFRLVPAPGRARTSRRGAPWAAARPPLARRALAGAALALSLCAAPAHATWQEFRAAQDGLADNQVLSIAEGSDGAIWFGTPGGASRFDGNRWSTIADSLPSRVVYSLLEDRRGALWFGTQNAGLAKLENGRWSRYDVSSGTLPSNTVLAALEDAAGDLWFGTSGGLVRFEPGPARWTTYLESPTGLVNKQAWRLLEDQSKQLWIATPEGVSRLDPTRSVWTRYTQDPLALGRDSVLALGEDATGGVWFGTDLGAWRLGPSGWSHYDDTNGLSGKPVTAIARDSLGRMWFGGFIGVTRFDGQTFRVDQTTDNGRAIGQVASLRVDRSGNVWIGTVAGGAIRYDGVSWHNETALVDVPGSCPAQPSPGITPLRALGSNCLTAMLQDAAGDLWFSTYDGGVTRLDRAGRWTVQKRAPGIPISDTLSALAEDRGGNLWFASRFAGVARLDPTRTTWGLEWKGTGLAGDSVTSVLGDREGDVWVGTTNGVGRFSGGAWSSFVHGGVGGVSVQVFGFFEDAGGRLWIRTTVALYMLDPARAVLSRYGINEGLPDDVPTAIASTPDGTIWVGTEHGLAHLPFGTSTWIIDGAMGAPLDSAVNSLVVDHLGRLWVAGDRSAAWYDGSGWTRISVVDLGSSPIAFDPDRPVQDLFEDSGGTMWVSTFGGLARTNGESWHRYDNRGGLAGTQVTGFLEDRQHRLWFSSDGGLTEHEPDRVAPQTIFVNRPPALSPSRNASFVFAAAYGEVADLEYSTSWDGAPFSPFGTDNTFSISGVSDGIHTFDVTSRDWSHNVDPSPAHFTFEVDATPPAAVIASPRFGDPVRGSVPVVGTTVDPRFASWQLAARPVGSTSWNSPPAVNIASATKAANGDTLAIWNTTSLAEGNWELRLSVTDTLGLVGATLIQSIVDNQPPYANVTTPVHIVAKDGGDVYTTHSEVHLYFPPQSFDADATVTIDPVSDAPTTLPDGGTLSGQAWSIGWTQANLVHDATLEMSDAGGGSAPAVYAQLGTGPWQRLGGSPQPSQNLGLPFRSPGRYAIYVQGAAAPSGSGLTVSLSPRAFSPRGAFAAHDIAIGFSLGRPGSATVKIYDRAGRLVKTVVEGMDAGTGANLVRWDGRSRDGDVVPPGLYLITVQALGQTQTKTVAVVE